MKRWKPERKEILLFLLSSALCTGMVWEGMARSRWGRDLAALSKRALSLSPSDQSLLEAVKANDFNAVRLAIEAGADVNCQDRARFLSPVGTAPITYYTPLILSTMDSMQARFSRGRRPKHLDVMNYLLEHGADPNLDGSEGTTALYLASGNGDLDAVRLLLQAGADPNGRSSRNESPMGRACYFGRFEVAKLLREKGASVDQADEFNTSPLHYTIADHESPEISRWLISQDANVNARDSSGQTPLHLAALYGRVDAVRLLMRSGADPSVQNLQGHTSVDIASQYADSVVKKQYSASRIISARVQQTQGAMLAAMREKMPQGTPLASSKLPNY